MARDCEIARLRNCAIAFVVLLAACGKHEFHPPSQEQQVAQADSLYNPAVFDSIHWPSDAGRLLVGNEVYARKCDKCHGPLGKGGTDYARQQNLQVPSLVRSDWQFGNNPDTVRRRVFIGHTNGMPTWGVAELSAREVDAVTAYVIEQLRPDALKTK